MSLEQQISQCSENYSRWKQLAIVATDTAEVKRCLEKALFWLELQSALVALWSVEEIRGNEPAVKRKLLLAKANLSKKLADYADKTLKELGV